MPKNTIIALIYHHHKLLNLIYYKMIKECKKFNSYNLDDNDFPSTLFLIVHTILPLIYTENTR
jgi:hypothetical protein